MELIFDYLKSLFDEKLTILAFFDMINDGMLYYYVKSHRSNVTEGNTTKCWKIYKNCDEKKSRNSDYIVPSKPAGETYEIDNLVKVI